MSSELVRIENVDVQQHSPAMFPQQTCISHRGYVTVDPERVVLNKPLTATCYECGLCLPTRIIATPTNLAFIKERPHDPPPTQPPLADTVAAARQFVMTDENELEDSSPRSLWDAIAHIEALIRGIETDAADVI